MKPIYFFLFLCISSIVARAPVAAQQLGDSSPEQLAVEVAARAFVTAYDAGNADAVAALWTQDGEYVIGQQIVKGRPAIKKLYADFFKAHPGSKMQIKIDSVRKVAPNLLSELGTATVKNSPNGPTSSSNYWAVHVNQNGKWLMASVQESDVPLPPVAEDLEQLAWLVGNWSGSGEAARVELKFDWTGDKHFLRGETTVHPKAKGPATSGGMQIIGKDPLSGQIVSWFFNADGGHSYGVWTKNGDRWLINTQGATAEGAVTTATNVFYPAHENVLSWQSINRVIGDVPLPNTAEIVLERASATQPVQK